MTLAQLAHPRTGMMAITLGLALYGCSPSGSGEIQQVPQSNAAPTASAAPSPPAPAAGTTVGGDGSAIVLATLSMEEVEAAKLEGELACSFAAQGAAPLLVAMGDVASKSPSQGIVKVADSVERVAAPGGFDGMLDAAVFTGAGKTLRIAVTGPPIGNAESPPQPATLTYQRADGASRTFAGEWTCGP